MAEDPERRCVHCGAAVPAGALVCGQCGGHQVSRSLARFLAHPLTRLLKVVGIAVIVGLGGLVYQEESARHQARAERSRNLVDASLGIQVLAEQLQHPCPLAKENEEECGNIYETKVGEFSRLAYVFKNSARHLLDRYPSHAPIHAAIDFIDDFYNPGRIDAGRMMVFPLQIELLRSRDLLTLTREDARRQWCSVEARAQLRALAASFDTYRYCYQSVRGFVAQHANRNWLLARLGLLPLWPESEGARRRLRACSEGDLEATANRIFELLNGDERANYTAAWHYDLLCDESPRESVQGGIVPPASEQLVVVSTKDWNATTGTLQRFERSVGGPWQRRGDPLVVNVGRAGLAWGRGLHPFPGLAVGEHPDSGAERTPPPKREGDGRAPAGLFRLETTYYDPRALDPEQAALLRLDARPTNATMYCEDRPERAEYNSIVTLDADGRAGCEAVGRCPEAMVREDGAYDLVVWVDHNKERARGAGSCIFLHVERGEGVPTAGCTSAPRNGVGELLSWLDPARVPVLLQLPRDEYELRRKGWVLPPLQ